MAEGAESLLPHRDQFEVQAPFQSACCGDEVRKSKYQLNWQVLQLAMNH